MASPKAKEDDAELAPLAQEETSGGLSSSSSATPSPSSALVTPIRDCEDMLSHVGGWGPFQLRLLCIFFPFTLLLSYVSYFPVLFLYVPADSHWCRADAAVVEAAEATANRALTAEELRDLTVPKTTDEDGAEKWSACYMYDIPDPGNAVLTNTSEQPWEKIKCRNGWHYDLDGYFHSASTDMDWVCDDTWKASFTQSIFFVGAVIGTIIFGYTADEYGRAWTFRASNILLLVTSLLTPFCDTFSTFTAIRFMQGLSHYTYFASFNILSLEYMSIDKRTLMGNLSLAIGMTVGGCYMPWLLKYLGDWKTLNHILYAQGLVIFVTPCVVHESVRWLSSKGRVDEGIEILGHIAKINGRALQPSVARGFRKMVEKKEAEATGVKHSWWRLFSTPRLRRNTILMILTWVTIAAMFDGHVRNISNLKFSIYVTFTVSSFLELPADLLAIWGLDFFGRRWSAFISLVLTAILMLLCAMFVGKDFPVTVTVLAMCGRFFMTYAMNTGAQISMEVVPTQLRGQGVALANVCAMAATFFSPIIVYSSNLSEQLPFLILSAGAVVGALIGVNVPETAGVDLPDTVEDAEEFGKDQKFFSAPFGSKLRKRPLVENEKKNLSADC